MMSAILATAVASSFMNVKVVSNYDGDTFSVHLQNLPEVFSYDLPVRIRGIDTPELKSQTFCERFDAIEARDALEKMLSNKMVDLLNCQRDKYFRLLCDVRVSGIIDIKTYMLSSNFAVSYDGKTKAKWVCKREMP